MRRTLLVLPFLIACGGSETPPADSAAAMPAALTEADVAGTWTGTLTPEGSDLVTGHWTQVCAAGTCRGTSQENPGDTTVSTYTIETDSVVGMTGAFMDSTVAAGVSIVDHWVARPVSGQVTGHGRFVLADRPDSVIFRYRITGSRTP